MLLPRPLDKKIQSFLEKKGYVRTRSEDAPAIARRKRLLDSQRIDLVIDVGANEGQFANQLRGLGYQGRIHSFEPMQLAWQKLSARMGLDALWDGSQLALGDEPSEMRLNVSNNSVSSSLLEMLPRHVSHAPGSAYAREEVVQVSRLDDEFPAIAGGAENIWLKLDVQGYEYSVLRGARDALACCKVLQIEMSLAPLYAKQATFLELCTHLDDAGFEPIGFEAGFQELASGVLLQMDGIFRNRRMLATTGDDLREGA